MNEYMRLEVIAGIPFEFETVREIQWNQLLGKLCLSGGVSLAIFVVRSAMKKREDRRSELL